MKVLPFMPRPNDEQFHREVDAELQDHQRRAELVKMADREIAKLDTERWIAGVIASEVDL